MSKFSEALDEVSTENINPDVTVELMSEEDQATLSAYMHVTAKEIVEDPETTDDKEHLVASALLYGFSMGHNWVKDHWALW